MRRLLVAGTAALVFLVAGCGGPPPPEVETRRGKITGLDARAHETYGAKGQTVTLVVTLANVGTVAIDNVGAEGGRVTYSGTPLTARFAQAAPEDPAPLPKGQTRSYTFVAQVPGVELCTQALTCLPNPHAGLIAAGLTVTSNVGLWLVEAPAPLTCEGDYPRACARSIAEACEGSPASGGLARGCHARWQDVLATNLCGVATSDLIADCIGGFRRHTVVIGSSEYTYFYDQSDTLVAITVSGTGPGSGCVAGPACGFAQPLSCDELQPFYECSSSPTDVAK